MRSILFVLLYIVLFVFDKEIRNQNIKFYFIIHIYSLFISDTWTPGGHILSIISPKFI